MRRHLDHVEWLLGELPTWDDSLAPRSVRAALNEFYTRQQSLLLPVPAEREGLEQATPVVDASAALRELVAKNELGVRGASVILISEKSVEKPVQPLTPTLSPLPQGEGAHAHPAPVVFSSSQGEGAHAKPTSSSREEAPKPTPVHVPAAKPRRTPSPWTLLIKPVLHESLGWFLGAFLILAGALYLIGDAWGGMNTTTRALTVFGLVEVWAVGFAVWAAALSKKPTTRGASASLRRIAALVAPLAVLTLGHALDSPLAWLALAVGSAIAAVLTFHSAKDLEEPGSMLGASVLLSTVGVGLAPVLPVGSGWAVLIPSVFAAWGFARGPRSNTSRTWAAVIAWLLPLALVATRFLLVPSQVDFTVAGLVVAAALLAGFALRLAAEDAPSRGVISVVSLSVLAIAFLASFGVAKPACVVVCLLAAWTTRQHALGGKPGGHRVWWLSGTYLFSFLAWQRIDQLVPPIVWVWWNQLKVSLGYAAAPMPASYGAVYQAVFISVGAVIAAVLFVKNQSRHAHVWLRTSAVAAGLSGLLAMLSVSTDARPALVALPMLALPMLGIGVFTRRIDALVAGSGLTALLSLVLQQKFGDGLPVMGIALACAGVAFALSLGSMDQKRRNRPARHWLAGTALFAAALVTLVGATQHGVASFIAVIGASVSSLVAARLLHRRVLSAAAFTTLAVFIRLDSPLAMSLVALGLAFALFTSRFSRRVAAFQPLVWSLAFLAPLWALATSWEAGSVTTVTAPTGLASLVSAATLFVLARLRSGGQLWGAKLSASRQWIDVVAALLVVNSVLPWSSHAGLFPGWALVHAQCALVLLALTASVHAVWRGRSAPGVALAAAASLASVLLAVDAPAGFAEFTWPAVTLALSTAALLPSITVPLAALFAAVAVHGDVAALLLLSSSAAVLALGEELDLSWKLVLNRGRVAWAGALTSAVLLVAALVIGAQGPVVIALTVILPLMWMRATRQGFVAAAAIPLFAATGAMAWAPLLAVAFTRGLSWNRLRTVLSLPELKRNAPEGLRASERQEGFVYVGVAALTAVASLTMHPGLEASWAGALLLLGGGAGALRVVLAACIAGVNPELRLTTVGALVALAALAHHAPRALRSVLGSRSVAWVESTSLLLALLGAGLSVATGAVPQLTPMTLPVVVVVALGAGLLATTARAWAHGKRTVRYPAVIVACLSTGLGVAALPATLAVPVTLIIAAVLLGAPVLVSFAAFMLGLDLTRTVSLGHPVLESSGLVALAIAALAVLLRAPAVQETVSTWWRKLGRESDGEWSLASALFWPALALSALALPGLDATRVLVPLALLLVTPRRHEQAAAFAMLAVATVWFFPAPVISVAFALAGVTLAALSRFVEHRLTPVWRVASWLFAGAAIVATGTDFGAWVVPMAWLSLVATAWLQLGQSDASRGWAWGVTGFAMHMVMAFVGVRLSTGAPMVLIFPWWALGSVALALVRTWRGGKLSATTFSVVALIELLCGVVLLHSAQPREAVVSVLVALALGWMAWRRMVESDDAGHAWLGQLAVVSGALAARVLGSGAMPGLTEAWVLLGASAVFAGLSTFFKREGRPGVGGVLKLGAWLAPALGTVLVPWGEWSHASLWLVGVSVLAAWLSRHGARRAGALVSASALNAALIVAAVGFGFSEWHLLLVPFGLTLLTLSWFFRDEVSVRSQILLRAWGIGFVYAAMAWKPLTANSVGALVLCVMVCLAGVALGALWRIRSYVLLGSGVVVTTVLATLVRSGLAEPRLGAVFLSLLGLGVVVVMVMITTKRDELRARMEAMQRVMASWSP